ncbi:MAG: DUF2510 domain-containing protein, partial [Acidimicrobiales bacterium]
MVLVALRVRPRIALALVAVGFAGLKTLPVLDGPARLVLGGPTLRDHADLVGLVALVPLLGWLEHRSPPPPSRRPPQLLAPGSGPVIGRRLAGGLVLVAAVLATSATSSEGPRRVEELRSTDQYVLARVASDYSEEWVRSDDGFVTSAPITMLPPDLTPGGSEVCIDDGCFRMNLGRAVQRRTEDGWRDGWRDDFRFSDEEYRRMVAATDGALVPVGLFSSIVATNSSAGELLVIAMGTDGVLVREPQGSYVRRAAGYATPVPIDKPLWLRQVPKWALIASAALFLIIPLCLHRRPARMTLALISCFIPLGLLLFIGGPYWDQATAALIGASLMAIIAALCALLPNPPNRPTRTMQPGWYLDASDRAWLRWYDGTNWTEHV